MKEGGGDTVTCNSGFLQYLPVIQDTVFKFYFAEDFFGFFCCQADTGSVAHPVRHFVSARIKGNRQGRAGYWSSVDIKGSSKGIFFFHKSKVSLQSIREDFGNNSAFEYHRKFSCSILAQRSLYPITVSKPFVVSKRKYFERYQLLMTSDNQVFTNMLELISRDYLQGKEEVLRLATIALLTGGHILIEDLPGLGKTTVALALVGITGLTFGRVQCTSDLLPSDITGLSIFNRDDGRFSFQRGPIFNNIVLLDEINRAMPRTQSAMLEAMEERRVTVEGVTHHLPDPFMVFATQNPSDQSGTFPLPESQLDRFLICTDIGYPPEQLERQIIAGGGIRERIGDMQPLVTAGQILAARRAVQAVQLSGKVLGYIHALVLATRSDDLIQTGLSTRAAISLAQVARASAFLAGRDYVAPEDVRNNVMAVCAHRLVMRNEMTTRDRGGVLRTIIKRIALPLV